MATQKIDFQIKEETAQVFFKQYNIQTRNPSGYYDERRDEIPNPYYLLKDRLLLKKECGITPGQNVMFTLTKQHEQLQRNLVNLYTYTVTEYDNVAVELNLIDFRIAVEDK